MTKTSGRCWQRRCGSGLSDAEQLAFAVKQHRAVITHNIRDYVLLDSDYRTNGLKHHGILVCDQVPFKELLRRVVRCLSKKADADVYDQVVWLQDLK